jgi:hypothetical protein
VTIHITKALFPLLGNLMKKIALLSGHHECGMLYL